MILLDIIKNTIPLLCIVWLLLFIMIPYIIGIKEVWKNKDNAYGQGLGIFMFIVTLMPFIIISF